jgi:hypothetical protein
MLALGSRSSRVGFDEESAYWVGATTAAELLGVQCSTRRVTQRWVTDSSRYE